MTENEQRRYARRTSYGLGPFYVSTGRMVPWASLSPQEKLMRMLVAWCGLWKRTGSAPRLARMYQKALIAELRRVP